MFSVDVKEAGAVQFPTAEEHKNHTDRGRALFPRCYCAVNAPNSFLREPFSSVPPSIRFQVVAGEVTITTLRSAVGDGQINVFCIIEAQSLCFLVKLRPWTTSKTTPLEC